MTDFEANLKRIQRMLGKAGFAKIREPYDTGRLAREVAVRDVEVIAKKDYYTILYLEAESNWRGIATDVARKNGNPCLVITRYGAHTIMSTMRDHGTLNPRPRHVVIEGDAAKRWSIDGFVGLIRVRGGDDFLAIDGRVQSAMDAFSDYRDALGRFGENLGGIIDRTQKAADRAIRGNAAYKTAAKRLLGMFRETISDAITLHDIRDMLVQHILTHRIFSMVYDVEAFHGTNAVARELENLKGLLSMPESRVDYSDIEVIAESITGTGERQEFLKRLYETFYEQYDPKKADRDGIVYTPTEVVEFIIKSTDHLLRKNFARSLSDEEVVILDPFTGTGTFIVHVLERISMERLKKKYAGELHANEISILPYYIAALNIENAYRERAGEYCEFGNICWMDTFESGTKNYEKMTEYMGYENVRRIAEQQKSRINVIIGNPPYSAKQSNYNDENPNLSYPYVDARIKETYARKTKSANINSLYDSYIRAFRWASDRIAESGIVAFVTNGGFLRSDAAAGVRAYMHEEFTDVWCLDLRGNQRTQGETSRREGGKIFGSGSRAPVAITILVRNPGKKEHEIHYRDIGDYLSKEQKLKIIGDASSITGIKKWQVKKPDKNYDWLDQRDDTFTEYVPMGSKETKSGKGDENAIFRMFSRGIATGRDAWVYNSSRHKLSKNMKKHISYCNRQDLGSPKIDPQQAKWSDELSGSLARLNSKPMFEKGLIRIALYRPFFKQCVYFEEKAFIHRPHRMPLFFPKARSENIVICVPHKFSGNFSTLITEITPDLNIITPTQCFPLYTYEHQGKKTTQKENITDCTLKEYRTHYRDDQISKIDIFYYVYGMLHHPSYRKKYANNLSKELPRIPMAPDFRVLNKAGKALADLHLGFFDENREDNRHPLDPPKRRFGKPAKLAFDRYRDPKTGRQRTNYTRLKINGILAYDNIPEINYRVNGRTPLEWLADRYRFTTDSDSGITNDPCESLTEKDIISLVERAVHVGVRSDEIIGSLPEEFEPAEWMPKKTGLDAHMDLGEPTQSAL